MTYSSSSTPSTTPARQVRRWTFCFCDEDDGERVGRSADFENLGLYDLPTDKNTLLLDLVWPLGLALLAKLTAVVLFAHSCRGTAAQELPPRASSTRPEIDHTPARRRLSPVRRARPPAARLCRNRVPEQKRWRGGGSLPPPARRTPRLRTKRLTTDACPLPVAASSLDASSTSVRPSLL